MDSEKWDCVPIPTAGGKALGKQYFSGTSGYMLNAKSVNVDKAFQVYKDIFANKDFLIGYYEGGFGVSIVPEVIEAAKPSEDFQNKKWLLISDIDTLLPKPPHTSIYYGGADIESTLQDLTDRYNKGYQDAIQNGVASEIKIDGYDPMNPTLN